MSSDDRPLLRIVRGTPDDAELAALTAVVASLPGPAEEAEPEQRSAWGDPASRMRAQVRPGPGAWRASGFPH
ncbi:acetyl-CoA carboxylase biotin carboxyl carrier protein subunit [Actinosynnema sp. ALI-1.44]|uniref:acyl-CoA carboxylase subunit epsilon n=1 Tax=Actinosynnema sp. ALI-1.44 TaxID=1933779 RepID=UPI00097C19B9|nr:acyl-CoA carboxylase subunit epsilon [Actinosynnema sp. ALI-1.44]ONI85909.1 acetyl-CoA carboxylase biotin carboxyl carrier protein subunit [Actinosynnema sp. ALI-1.44]